MSSPKRTHYINFAHQATRVRSCRVALILRLKTTHRRCMLSCSFANNRHLIAPNTRQQEEAVNKKEGEKNTKFECQHSLQRKPQRTERHGCAGGSHIWRDLRIMRQRKPANLIACSFRNQDGFHERGEQRGMAEQESKKKKK